MKIGSITALFCALFVVNNLLADESDSSFVKPIFGVFFHYGLNAHISGFAELSQVPNCCRDDMIGTGSGINAGFLLQHKIHDVFDTEFRLGVSDFSGLLTQTQDFKASIYDKTIDDFVLTDGVFEYKLNTALVGISISSLVLYDIHEKTRFLGGFDIGYLILSDFSYVEEIKTPKDGFFQGTNRSRRRNLVEGELENVPPLYLSFQIGMDYHLQMDQDSVFFLHPEFLYSLMLTPVVANSGWAVNSFRAGVAVKYLAPPPPPPPPLPPFDPPLPKYPAPLKNPHIYINITATQVDSLDQVNDDIEIKLEDFVTLFMSPLLTYVFFEENSYEIPDRYKKLNPAETRDFSIAALQRMQGLETYHHILNIIGLRLGQNHNANITLIGTNADVDDEKGNIELSRERAESVKKYLVNIWNIDPIRIDIKARNLPEEASSKNDSSGQEENRRVEIVSDDWRITEPLIIDDTTRIISKTKIRFYPEVLSELPIKNWSLTIMQNGAILRKIEGDNKIPHHLDWDITTDSPDAPKFGGQIKYVFKVSDIMNKSVRTKESWLPVEQMTVERKKIEKKLDTEYEYYSLILFDFGRFRLKSEHKEVLNLIKDKITENSKVIISGHTDIMGSEAFNKKISKSRASVVAKELNLSDVEIIGSGQENLLYDNSLPEGRFYCRTVRIMVETKVKNK